MQQYELKEIKCMNPTMLAVMLTSLLSISLFGQKAEQTDQVETIDDYYNLYLYQHYYIAGQPSLDEFKWLESKGVTKVINLRTESENEDFASASFNEKSVVEELGMEYHSIPVSGRSGYTPENLTRLGELISEDEIVLIHCGGAGRATSFLMGYLVRFKGYSLDEAVDVGQEMTYFISLENLLDIEITMHAK
jgi:protein tyrosine phosphatase (PTP) superfamily phosphohydrolase (DUF442 family)